MLRRDYPTGPLAAHVEFIAQRRDYGPPVAYRIAPTGRAELLFNFGDVWSIGEPGGQRMPLPACAILPARRKVYSQHAGPSIDWLVVALTPLGCRSVLGSSLAQLWAHSETAPASVPALLLRLHQDLKEIADPADRLARATELLETLTAMAPRCPLLEIVHQARYRAYPTARALADAAGMSDRQLRNRFRDAIGMSPKAYLQLLRFNRHLAAIHPEPWLGEPQASADEMFDESHAIREFARYLDQTPASYRRHKITTSDRLIYASTEEIRSYR